MLNSNTVDVQCRLRPAVRAAASNPRRKDAPPTGPGKLPRVTQVLALAIQFDDWVRRGEVRDFADLARLGCLSRARISQVLKLLWLAPDIQAEILALPRSSAGRFPISEVATREVAGAAGWQKQRSIWGKLKQEKHLS